MDASIPKGAALLLDFIAKPESGDSYTVIYGHHETSLPKPITAMTVNELMAAQAVWGKQWGSSAAGRYQIMPATLKSLMSTLGLKGTELFTSGLQDRCGYALLLRRGYASFAAKTIPIATFAKQLTEEWASMPVLADTMGAHLQVKRGQSYYAGDALNKALVTPESFEAVLTQALDASQTTPTATKPAVPVAAQVTKPTFAQQVAISAIETFFPQTKETIDMNISLFTLILNHLNLLPYLQQDITTEIKVVNSSQDGLAKTKQTIAVLKDVLAQLEASIEGTPIPAATAIAPAS